jgi:hypothetical protein
VLCERIGRLKRALDWLRTKLPGAVEAQRSMIELGQPEIRVHRQCELTGLHRSSLCRQPAGESQYNPMVMRLLARQYARMPFSGGTRMTAWLRRKTHAVHPKRVRRLLGLKGLQAVYRRPSTSTTPPCCGASRSCTLGRFGVLTSSMYRCGEGFCTRRRS